MAHIDRYARAVHAQQEYIRTYETCDRTAGQERYAEAIAAIGVESWLYDEDTVGAAMAAEWRPSPPAGAPQPPEGA